MENNIFNSLNKRRSQYDLKAELTISEDEVIQIIENALLQTPSAFNSQTGRMVLLLNENHIKLWDIVLTTLKPLVPETAFPKTVAKIDSFKKAYGTILFFEEDKIVKGLQESFPLYAETFPNWSEQSAGMLNLVVWTALAEVGVGASLQHYNPLIDDEVKKTFNLPASWRLISQMPFGLPQGKLSPKDQVPVKDRYQVIK